MFSFSRTRARFAPCVLGVAVFCSAPAVARAQAAPAPTPSPSPAPEIGRITTSDRQSEAASSTTHPTFVVDRNAIESFGSRNIGDALANVPGVTIVPYGAFGAQNNYGIRGTTSAQTLVLQDGVPIAAGSNGTVDLGALSTIGVQRIEIVESAGSTLYGSGATGGVINIITARAAEPYFRVADGTYGDRDLAAQLGTSSLAASFERHIATNVYDYPGGTRSNDDAQQTVARLSFLAPLGNGWTARLAGGDTALNTGVPGGLSFLTPFARQGTQRTDALLDLTHAGGGGSLDLTLSTVGQKLLYRDTLLDLTGAGSGFGEQDTFDARSQASLRFTSASPHFDFVSGVDAARETAVLTFPPSMPPQPAAGAAESQAALYAQAGFSPRSSLRFVAGLRAENDTPGGSVLAPAFGARIGMGAAELRANVSESFRVPTLVDLYYPGFSNPNLQPEKLTNFDATLAFPALAGGVSVGYFGRDGSNAIVLDPLTFAPYNAARVSVNGWQLVAASRPLGHVRATVSLTNLYRALDTSTGLRLPDTPPVTATLGFERPFDRGALAFGARVRVVGSTPDGYTVADAYVRIRLAPAAILTLRSANAGNAAYTPIAGYPAPGRTLTVELATR